MEFLGKAKTTIKLERREGVLVLFVYIICIIYFVGTYFFLRNISFIRLCNLSRFFLQKRFNYQDVDFSAAIVDSKIQVKFFSDMHIRFFIGKKFGYKLGPHNLKHNRDLDIK